DQHDDGEGGIVVPQQADQMTLGIESGVDDNDVRPDLLAHLQGTVVVGGITDPAQSRAAAERDIESFAENGFRIDCRDGQRADLRGCSSGYFRVSVCAVRHVSSLSPLPYAGS